MIGGKKMPDIILVSGGFDPIHSGHIKLINDANKYGDVVVLLNSDAWLRNKKGKEFLSFDERKIIMQNIKGVLDVLDFDDSDQSCVDGILKAKNLFQNNIETLFGVGGNNKSNSSSWILKKWKE